MKTLQLSEQKARELYRSGSKELKQYWKNPLEKISFHKTLQKE